MEPFDGASEVFGVASKHTAETPATDNESPFIPRRYAAEDETLFASRKRRETTMASAPKVDQISPNEVVVSCPLGAAFAHVSGAIGRMGKVKQDDRSKQFIDGRIKYGLQSVKVRASLVEREQGKTHVVIQASSDDVWGAGAKNATERLVETLRNLDNPGYEPDRLGMHPAALVGLLIGFVFLLLLIMKHVLPQISG